MDRPKVLLMPDFTQIEWMGVRPRLEQRAKVASFDPPGVGDEPRAERLDHDALAKRGLEELDRRGWERCFVASNEWGIGSAVRLAVARPWAVVGLALGHAKLSQRRDGDRAPINGAVWEALDELVRKDHEAFIRYAIPQVTGGSIDERLAQKMVERFPHDLVVEGWESITGVDEQIGLLLDELDCPLLFAKHQGCLLSTEEGFDDAAAAFPRARTISIEDPPLRSEEFADALLDFCEEVATA